MKKVVVAAFSLVSLTQVAKAQKGSVLVGGNVGIESAKQPSTPNDQKQTSFTFTPTVGYQFNENWTAGILADIESNKYTNSANVVSKTSKFGIGPFVRYSKSISNIFGVFGQVQGVFGSEKNFGAKSNFTDVKAFPAVFINVKNGFGLNFDFGGIGYSSVKPSGSSASTDFNLSFGKTVNIGVSKNFGGSKKK